MICLDIEYYKPTTVKDAIDLFVQLDLENRDPVYYAGGTEFISMARMNRVKTGAIIDIKGIPECQVLGTKDGSIFMGSGVTLSTIGDSNMLPLLSRVIRLLADRTSRNKITLGGNICGKIPYKEAMLPFLLLNSTVKIAGPNGHREINANELFHKDSKLGKEEILLQVITDASCAGLPFHHIKRTRQEKVDYPLVSASFVKEGKNIRLALSGVCKLPFRSTNMEDILNNTTMTKEEKANGSVNCIREPISDNLLGSAKYREFVLKDIIRQSLQKLGGE